MDAEKSNLNDNTEPVPEETKHEEPKESTVESLITPEIEENPDLEDPRLYSPLVDTEKPDPRIAVEGADDTEPAEDSAGE